MINENKAERYCRVCGIDEGEEGVRMKGGMPTFNICVCCGIEFGYEDKGGDIKHLSAIRKHWLFDKQAKWWNEKFKPKDWSLCQQLKQVPDKYKDEWMKQL